MVSIGSVRVNIGVEIIDGTMTRPNGIFKLLQNTQIHHIQCRHRTLTLLKRFETLCHGSTFNSSLTDVVLVGVEWVVKMDEIGVERCVAYAIYMYIYVYRKISFCEYTFFSNIPLC